MQLNRWKLIAGGAALVGVAIGGTAAADSDDGFDLNDRQPIELTAEREAANTGFDLAAVDLSPESPDSPGDSPVESPDSPFDSPDDDGLVLELSEESPDSPNDSPEDSPSPATADGDSPESPESPESPDSPNSADT